ncbi:MAG: response regulator [Candidatus Diapherotrites archaeon]|nr:response regulator [Candidatus Diapherotrites archaeon]
MGNILIVEDEPDMARTIQIMLESEGYSTEIAENVDKAMNILKTKGADLVLLDIILPQVHGDVLLKKMQKSEKLKKVPVIVVTVVDPVTGIKEDMKEIKKDVGFISKPFKKEHLLREVKQRLKDN